MHDSQHFDYARRCICLCADCKDSRDCPPRNWDWWDTDTDEFPPAVQP